MSGAAGRPAFVALYLEEAAAARTPAEQPAVAPVTLTRWMAALGAGCRAVGHLAPGGCRSCGDRMRSAVPGTSALVVD
jgi:hypothetical protein